MPIPFDAHSHLPEVGGLEESAGRGDHLRVVCGTCEADWEAVLAHAAGDGRVIPMLGLHPWFADEASSTWAVRLESLLRAHPVGVGECGLDFARKDGDQTGQEAVFRLQLRLAHVLHRPVAIHAVRAWGGLIGLLREEGVPAGGALIHAYSGSPETARQLQAMGVFLSFSGDLLDPGRAKVRESLKAVAPRHLLLETDGTVDLKDVIEAAARIRGATMAELEVLTWENGRRCFKELLG
ncbi:MAG TPA: TatD family hydrolase [Geothrix sp.]|jgi:TatD DNase family protein